MTVTKGLELISRVTSAGELELSLVEVPVATPGPDEVVVRVRATPLNPSDQGLLLGAADLATVKASGPVTTATIPAERMAGMKARLDQPMKVGNEGAGTIVEAGANAQHMLGKTVAILAGAMYAEYRTVKASDAIVLPEGITAAQGASIFVNPLTVMGFITTMKHERHTAIVHTAAASNLGQMLTKACTKDGIGLVNIVRSAEQAKILRDLGAKHVVDSTAGSFAAELTDAIAETGATIAFDAIGGGPLTNQILRAMETAVNRTAKAYSRYGSSTHKQVYIYGGLDPRPTELDRSYGLAWGVSGWLVMPWMMKMGADAMAPIRARILAELASTFESKYSETISLREVLQPDVIARYAKKATGEKFLIDPSK